jgi:hypothetical protein
VRVRACALAREVQPLVDARRALGRGEELESRRENGAARPTRAAPKSKHVAVARTGELMVASRRLVVFDRYPTEQLMVQAVECYWQFHTA